MYVCMYVCMYLCICRRRGEREERLGIAKCMTERYDMRMCMYMYMYVCVCACVVRMFEIHADNKYITNADLAGALLSTQRNSLRVRMTKMHADHECNKCRFGGNASEYTEEQRKQMVKAYEAVIDVDNRDIEAYMKVRVCVCVCVWNVDCRDVEVYMKVRVCVCVCVCVEC